ncbi:hypothetical protein N9Y92_04050 [Chlamydiales bacterium]|nr:hypothetical protein [Chlamydiales bacterium]
MAPFFSTISISHPHFKGPLDLLVHLAQKKELSLLHFTLFDLFLSSRSLIDLIDEGGGFLEDFCHLILLKSRELLPFEEDDEEVIEPRPEEMMEHLLAYCEFKQVALELDSRYLEDQKRFFCRNVDKPLSERKGLGVEHLSLEDLQSLFQKIIDQKIDTMPDVTGDVLSVTEGIQWIKERGEKENPFLLVPFLEEISSKQALIVTFLALLEEMKLGGLFVRGSPPEVYCSFL